MRVLVTGAGGFLGRRLVPLLSERHDVVAVARRPVDGVDTLLADLGTEDLPELPPGLDAVVHLAQSRRYREWPGGAADMYALNVDVVFTLLEHARTAGVSHFVLASTGAVYAPADDPIHEDGLLRPAGFYARSKFAAEVLTEGYADDLVTVIMRPFAIYGAGQRNTLVANLAAGVHEREELVVRGDPGLRINPIHVDDAARAFAAALERSTSGAFNVAGSEVVSLTALVEQLADLAGTPPRIRHTGDASPSLIGDIARMRDVLGTAPQVGLREGLADVLSELVGRAR